MSAALGADNTFPGYTQPISRLTTAESPAAGRSCPDRVDESVEGLDCGSNLDGAVGDYVGAQTATVDQSAEDPLGGEPFEVGTRFAQSLAEAFHIANTEAASHQRVEVDAVSNDVAPRLRVAQAAILVQQQVVEDLCLDEREVVADPRSVCRREGARLSGVAVTGASPRPAMACAVPTRCIGPVATSASASASTRPFSRERPTLACRAGSKVAST